MSEDAKELSPEEKLWAVKVVPTLLRINMELQIPVFEDG